MIYYNQPFLHELLIQSGNEFFDLQQNQQGRASFFIYYRLDENFYDFSQLILRLIN